MADILTQLQDALDILLQQFYASLVYTSTRHPYADIPGQPHDADRDLTGSAANDAAPTATGGASQADGNGAGGAQAERPRSPPPDPAFAATQHEIAQDMVLNMARVQALVDRLPGIGLSEREQVARMRELDAELRAAEEERVEAVKEKERLLAVLDERIMRVRRP